MTELQDEFAIVLVYRLANLAPERDPFIAIDGRVVGHDAPADLNRNERRDDGADAAAREFGFPIDACLVPRAVVIIETSRDIRSEDTVLDGQVLEPDWFEQDVRHGCMLATAIRADNSFYSRREKLCALGSSSAFLIGEVALRLFSPF